ncbi:MAG: glycosyltransferase family 2 protein [Verrucomicrobiota bacterium]
MTPLLILTLLLGSAGWLLLGRAKPMAQGASQNVSADQLSLIIPARNEEQNLPRLLRSIAAQSLRPTEIIVVNDASSDRTAAIARECGAVVLDSRPLPEGWRGKTWACHQGQLAAKGALLLFADADTWFEPGGLARVLSLFHDGAWSVAPFHAVRNPYESLSLFFNLNMTMGTVPNGLFGQMLLVDRASYRRAGGHEAVKGRTLENFFLAQQFRAAGIPTRSLIGRGSFACRMYPNGLRELIDGWTKGFASGATQTPRPVLLMLVGWMTGLMLGPAGWLMTSDHARWGPVYLLGAVQVGWLSRRIGSFGWIPALLYPLPLVFFFAVFVRSALRSGRQVTWKGRQIRAD